jgi:hypothetical protein
LKILLYFQVNAIFYFKKKKKKKTEERGEIKEERDPDRFATDS